MNRDFDQLWDFDHPDETEGRFRALLPELVDDEGLQLEVLTQIKSDPQLKMIPVVMLTSSREEADLVNSYQRGVNAYVVKPVTFAAFVEALRELGVFWAEINEPPPGSIGRRTARNA